MSETTRSAAAICICGLAAEAGIARVAGFAAVIGAGDRNRTAAIAQSAVRRASCLISFGIAGALAPELRPGDLVISTEIVVAGRRWRAEEPFRQRVADLAASISARQGPVLGADAILATRAEKRRAWSEAGALAVDLESAVVASIATAAGIPFVALRAIADAADRELPPAALIPLAADGTPRLAQVLASVLRRPRQMPALIGLARDTRTALAALAGPARALRGLLLAA